MQFCAGAAAQRTMIKPKISYDLQRPNTKTQDADIVTDLGQTIRANPKGERAL